MFLFPFSGPLPAFSRCFVPGWGLVFGFRENQASGSSLTKEQFEPQVSNQLRKSGFAERSCWSPIVNSQSLSLQLLVQRKNKNDRRDEYSQLSNGLQLECRYSRLPIHLEIWMQNLFPVLLSCQSNLLTRPQPSRTTCLLTTQIQVARVTDPSKRPRDERVSFGLAQDVLRLQWIAQLSQNPLSICCFSHLSVMFAMLAVFNYFQQLFVDLFCNDMRE